MYLWRRNYPRVFQPVVCIHGIYYVVKDEVVFKRHGAEWILPSAMAKHIKYNPRNLPVIVVEKECSQKPSPAQWVPSSSHGASASLLPDVSFG